MICCGLPAASARALTLPPPPTPQALITVTRGTDGGISVASSAFAVTGVESVSAGSAPFWPTDSPYNFCYLGVDPLTKTVTAWYGASIPW